jgi:hypothetical protein
MKTSEISDYYDKSTTLYTESDQALFGECPNGKRRTICCSHSKGQQHHRKRNKSCYILERSYSTCRNHRHSRSMQNTRYLSTERMRDVFFLRTMPHVSRRYLLGTLGENIHRLNHAGCRRCWF